jgi:hypothetical protein
MEKSDPKLPKPKHYYREKRKGWQEETRQWPPESRGSKERDGGCIMYSLPHFTSHQHIFLLFFFYSSLE